MIEICYQDKEILLCKKPVGISTEASQEGQNSMVSLLTEMAGPVYPVHRLDQGVGGLMVFARTAAAAAHLSRQIQEKSFQKEYLAIISGRMEEPKGMLKDYLFRDAKKNKTYVVDRERKGVRDASLDYETIATGEWEGEPCSLLRIHLHTGRTHQIRAQFSARKHPLIGDHKYGSRTKSTEIALWSYALTFAHPKNRDIMNWTLEPDRVGPWEGFLTCREDKG